MCYISKSALDWVFWHTCTCLCLSVQRLSAPLSPCPLLPVRGRKPCECWVSVMKALSAVHVLGSRSVCVCSSQKCSVTGSEWMCANMVACASSVHFWNEALPQLAGAKVVCKNAPLANIFVSLKCSFKMCVCNCRVCALGEVNTTRFPSLSFCCAVPKKSCSNRSASRAEM